MDSFKYVTERACARLHDNSYPVRVSAFKRYDGHHHRYDIGLFHFATWLAGMEDVPFSVVMELPSKSDGGVGLNVEQAEKVILFEQQSDRVSFLQWREKIADWFDDCNTIDEACMPTLPVSGTRTLHLVASPIRLYRDGLDDKTFETWVWLTHNCKQPVWRVEGGFAFTSDEEAVKFKLISNENEIGSVI